MKKAASIKDMQRMYDSLTRPEEIAKAKRLKERQERKEEKRSDVGM